MKRVLKIIGFFIVSIPALSLVTCIYNEIRQPIKLQSLCDTAKSDVEVHQILNDAAKIHFVVRTGGQKGKDDNEWFDREYLRLGSYLARSKNITDDYSVVFAKPGMGYYACIVTHKDGLVKSAWFEDRSS